MSSIHLQRAKRWKTTAFYAEWYANAADYCQSSEGKREFEAWVLSTHGPIKGRQKLQDCAKAPRKKYGTSTGNVAMLNAAAVELGISDEALVLYHEFIATYGIGEPARTKPAIRRRRGESSGDWIARRYEAQMDGHKMPNIDLHWLHAIAISEYDKTKDTIEVWRTSPETFFTYIERRGQSTISFPDVVRMPSEFDRRVAMMDDAFRSSIHRLSLAHCAWSEAAALFEDLKIMGLMTPSSLERAYKKDTKLLWRLISCFSKESEFMSWLRGTLTAVLSWCDGFRPYLKRWRNADATSDVKIDEDYVKRNGWKSIFHQFVVHHISRGMGNIAGFFEGLYKDFLLKDPTLANEFSAEAYDFLGDTAAVLEFDSFIRDSDFGVRLKEHACLLAATPQDLLHLPHFASTVLFMDPAKFKPSLPHYDKKAWGPVGAFTRGQAEAWSSITGHMGILSIIRMWLSGEFRDEDGNLKEEKLGINSDIMWIEVDAAMMAMASTLDRDGVDNKGRVAKAFGLLNPKDPDRPMTNKYLFKSFIPQKETPRFEEVVEEVVTPTSVASPSPGRDAPSIPVAAPSETMAKSGHAYVSEMVKEAGLSKEKVKTRKGPSVKVVAANDPGDDDLDEAERLESLPDVLPAQYKLGKKVMKIFHRILDLDEQMKDSSNVAEKKGQLRWADFERAMKRVGFEVYQTAGSSVRFDPPAKTARPISFHRPHPDSTLTPQIMKWIGARLKRCYGWTTATFEREMQEGE